MTRFRSAVVLGASLALAVALAGCSSASTSTHAAAKATNAVVEPTPTPTPVSLNGAWKQTNSHSRTAWQAATITGDAIEIDWVSDSGDTKSLYWAGTVTPPTTAAQTFTWTSKNDTSKTANALLASPDPTKVFTYDHGVISYSASALGTTTTIKLAPQQ